MARLLRVVLLVPALGACLAGSDEAPPRPPASYTLREWHEQDGLPSDELGSVFQDPRGYLWIATNNSLARFDGRTFEPVDGPGGAYMRGTNMLAGQGTEAAGTIIIPGIQNGATGWFSLQAGTYSFQAEDALRERAPRSVFIGPDSSLWIGCEDGTVLRRHGDHTTVYEAYAEQPAKQIPSVAADTAGRVWIARGNRLARVDGNVLTEIPFATAQPEIRVASSARGGVWVFTRNALLRATESDLLHVVNLPRLLGAHFVQTAIEDRHGYLWAGTRSQGLFRIAGTDILQVPSSNEDITALCEDAEGNIWAATNGGGLSRLRPKAHVLFDQTSGLKDNFSYTVASDAAGAVWLANRDGGVARIVDGIVDPISRRAAWRAFSAMSVHPSQDGRMWITTGIGVYRTLAAEPDAVERIPELNPFRSVRATLVASNGDYWLAVTTDQVARWRRGSVTTFGPAEGFDGREVRAIAEDASGRIWLGAAEGSLFRSEGDRFERVPFPGADESGALQVIRFDGEGNILIGTTRHGVIVFPQGDLTHPLELDRDRGLPNNNISQILFDDYDRTWFASRGCVFWVHGRHMRSFAAGAASHVHAITLGEDDGLPSLSCLGLFQPAAWKSQDGVLWFATRRGVLRTDPSLVTSGGDESPVVTVFAITCDGRARSVATTVEIPSTVRKTQIRLSVLNLSAPESIQVRFRLEGFDDDWVVQGHDRSVTYPRLPSGRYVFSTEASNGLGPWNRQPELLTLIVTPPWWQTWWARLGYLLALVVAITLVVRRWGHRRLRRRLERSEQARAVERERTRIARNIHDDVGATLTRISLLTQAAQEEHPAHSPTLEKIYDATHAITRSMDEIVWAVNPRHDNTESLVYYLGNFAQSFLGTAGVRCRLKTPETLPEARLTSQIRHHLFLCCKEALNNVIKHADANEATVAIAVERDTLSVTISDDGRGLGAPHTTDATRIQNGNGLRNMQQRMADIRGTCAFETRPQGGTAVKFTVPIAPAKKDD